MARLAKCESTKWCCQHRDDSGTLLAHKISATQKSELFKYLKTTFSPHVRRLHAHNFRSKTRSHLNWLVSDFDSSTCQPRLSTAQNDFSKLRPGWWQFCWMTGVKFNSIHSILVRFLHITQFTVCAAKNLTVEAGPIFSGHWIPYLFFGQVPISSDIHVVRTFPDMSGARLSCRSWPDCSLRPFP